jgi:hypothetical protein
MGCPVTLYFFSIEPLRDPSRDEVLNKVIYALNPLLTEQVPS